VLCVLVLLLLGVRDLPARAADGDAQFLDTSVEADFPVALTFHLEAQAPEQIEKVELFWHASDNPALSVAFPDVESGTHVEVDKQIDMSVNYLPPGVDMEYFWRVTEADGGVSDSEHQTFVYTDQRHDWQTKTDGLVTLYWYSGNDDFAQDIVDTANRTIGILRDRFKVEGQEPIHITIYGNYSDLGEALPPNSAEWIGGQAYPELRVIMAAIQPGGGAHNEVRRIVPHEVSHLILHQATANPFNTPPTWLDEGLATYNQETEDERLPRLLDQAVRGGRLIPIRALNSSFPLDPDQALLSYAESVSIVSFIIQQYGDDKLGALLNSFKQEMSYDEAVQSALGMTIEELDAAWKASLGYQGDAPTASVATDGHDGGSSWHVTTGGAVLIGLLGGAVAGVALLWCVAFVLLVRRRQRGMFSR